MIARKSGRRRGVTHTDEVREEKEGVPEHAELEECLERPEFLNPPRGKEVSPAQAMQTITEMNQDLD